MMRWAVVAWLGLAPAGCGPAQPHAKDGGIVYERPAGTVHGAAVRTLLEFGYTLVENRVDASGFEIVAQVEKSDFVIQPRIRGIAVGSACHVNYFLLTSEEAKRIGGGIGFHRHRPMIDLGEYDEAPEIRADTALDRLRGRIERVMEEIR